MFGLFKKKKTETKLHAVADGQVIKIDEVSDPVFSQKMMGDGFAVIPANGKIFSPVEGAVVSIFPTKHAIGLKLDNGLEVLLHMGVDTVELKGEPFEVKVTEGQKVTPETLVAEVDLDALKEKGKDNAMIVVITNMDQVKDLQVNPGDNKKAGEEIGEVQV